MSASTTQGGYNKPSFPTISYIQRLVSLLPISIAVVSLYSPYLCVCLCVKLLSFFSLSYSSVQLFSCKHV